MNYGMEEGTQGKRAITNWLIRSALPLFYIKSLFNPDIACYDPTNDNLFIIFMTQLFTRSCSCVVRPCKSVGLLDILNLK